MATSGGVDVRTPSVETPYPDTVERQVRTTLEGLLAEMGGHPGEEAVWPDRVLDRDLGIGSLERVELLLRLEQQCGVCLPDVVMTAAETPADLVAAMRTAAPASAEPMLVQQALAGPGTATPAGATTLINLLAAHAQAQPERLDTIMDNQREVRPHCLCRVPRYFTGDLGRIVAERYRDVLASLDQEVLSKPCHRERMIRQ
jgi:acyl carrier protein